MTPRKLLVVAALLVAAGASRSQPPEALRLPRLPSTPPPSPPVYTPPVPPAPPPEKSVDDLLVELERVQAEKVAIEKREQELKATLRKKLEQQTERLKKLGVAPPVPVKEAEPDRIGRIIIEGNERTPDKKILDLLELQPGQILQYPALEPARTRLEKYGLLAVRVEVVPGTNGQFKDVRVKVIEPPVPSKP